MADDLTRPGTPATFPNQVDEALRRARAADQPAPTGNLDDQPIPFALTLDAYAALNRDDQFTALHVEYRARVEAYIVNRLPRPDRQLAEDLASEVFLSVWRTHFTLGRAIERPFSLLATVAKRRMADHYRLYRNTRETATDTGAWQYTNRHLAPGRAGVCQPVNTGFRTARIGGAW